MMAHTSNPRWKQGDQEFKVIFVGYRSSSKPVYTTEEPVQGGKKPTKSFLVVQEISIR